MAKSYVEIGKRVLEQEAQVLLETKNLLDERFSQAVELMLSCTGRVVLTGLGKSGHIARKISATLTSTGTPSIFLHSTEALHGDLGQIKSDDVLIGVTQSGETREVLGVVDYAKKEGVFVIGITGRSSSGLSQRSDVVLLTCVNKEADTLGLAPTASSTAALALGDALSVALMEAKNFSKQKFKSLHPGGNLGRGLLCLSEVMVSSGDFKEVSPEASFTDVLQAMEKPNYGIIAVKNNGKLVGSITDGDLRRKLLEGRAEAFGSCAKEIMNPFPKSLLESSSCEDALNLMEKNKITTLFVLNARGELTGLVRMHDMLEANVI
jgi:arabinose-5-phosphate isomerase